MNPIFVQHAAQSPPAAPRGLRQARHVGGNTRSIAVRAVDCKKPTKRAVADRRPFMSVAPSAKPIAKG
jgi:hypothetical protein